MYQIVHNFVLDIDKQENTNIKVELQKWDNNI